MNFIFLLAFLLAKKELPYPDTRIDLFYLVLFTRYNEKYGELLTYVWDICLKKADILNSMLDNF